MPDWLSIILLGCIEGITEFLPVSSTGHLLIAEHWLGHRSDLFNVVIQSGAVVAVIVVFAQRVRDLLTGWARPEVRDYLYKLGLAFVITAVGGLLLKKRGFELPETPHPVAWATLIGGIAFIVIERWLRNHPGRPRSPGGWPSPSASDNSSPPPVPGLPGPGPRSFLRSLSE